MLKTDTTPKRKIVLATRGSPLALAQTHRVLNTCAHAFPHLRFEIRVIKTTGDKLQTASLAHTDQDSLPSPTAKGLFTKELENALMEKSADMAVHSLKDLPTELPEDLILGGVLRRADAHDLLIYRSQALAEKLQSAVTDWAPGIKSYRGFKRGLRIKDLPQGATIASSSTRRQVQIQHLRPDIRVIPIRGNVGTRIRKLKEHPEIDATLLAAAGLERLEYHLFPDGHFTAPKAGSNPAAAQAELEGILGSPLEMDEMLPCVGQAAIGIEIRADDPLVNEICRAVSHPNTAICVAAEREFLRAQGGGCQSPVAAYAKIIGHRLQMRAVSFRITPPRWITVEGKLTEAEQLGREAASQLEKS